MSEEAILISVGFSRFLLKELFSASFGDFEKDVPRENDLFESWDNFVTRTGVFVLRKDLFTFDDSFFFWLVKGFNG